MWLAAALCGVPLSSAVAGGEDEAMLALRARKQETEARYNSFRLLDKHRSEDVMRVAVEHRNLVFSTPLNNIAADRSMRAALDDVPGMAFISLHRHEITGLLERFSLNIINFPTPTRADTVNISLQNGMLTILHSANFHGAMRQVILLQRPRQLSSAAGTIELLVTDTNAGSPQAQQLNFEAEDFAALVRDYPAEVNRYVRPMLRQLRIEHLLAPDPLLIWQVFSDARKPDAALTRKVRDLLPGLNDRSFRVRVKTLRELKALGRDAADVVSHMERAGLTPEQNIQLDRFLAQFDQLPTGQVARLRTDPTFLLDCLYSDDALVRQSALDRLRSTFRPDLEFDMDAPADVRSATVAALRQQLTPGQ